MTNTGITPVQPGERISEIDIVRGLALLGILMVNMSFFKYPLFFARYPSSFPEGAEQLAAWFIQLFFTGKFYAIFSFLFGLGFYIFMERTLAKGLELVPLYRRRLFALLGFGFIHLFFIWSGDILFTYALVGFILLKFRDKSVDAIRKWIIWLFIISIVLNFIFGIINGVGEVFAGEKYYLIMQDMIEGATAVYLYGSIGELILFRLVNEVPYVLIGLLVWLPAVLAFFLCGLYIGKRGIIKDIPGNLEFLKKVRNTGLPFGALLLLFYIFIETGVIPTSVMLRHALLSSSNYAASLFIFPAYVAVVLIALQKKFWKRFLAPVAAAGRMALTNYLAQTFICIIIFYGLGFGLFGTVSAVIGILITLAIFLVQVGWSNLWFKGFRYGPMEWLWRTITYKYREPILVDDRSKFPR